MKLRGLRIAISLFCAALLMFSCNNTTSTQKGTVTGIISLDGETDHSGILVSVYHAGIVPEKITEVQQMYPQLAFPINDSVFFDHRDGEPLKSGYTDTDGRFTITDLPYDEYIIAYSKEGWGYDYIHNVVIDSANSDINVITKSTPISLSQEVLVPPAIAGDFHFIAGVCYLISQDTSSLPGTTLHFEEGSKILLKTGVKLTLYGGYTFPDDDGFVIITSYAGIHQGSVINNNLGDGLVVWGVNDIHNVIVTNLNEGITVRSDNILISNSLVRSCETGIIVNNVSGFSLDRCAIISNTSSQSSAVYLYSAETSNVHHNLFFSNNLSLKHEISESVVHNNAFIQDIVSFENTAFSNGIFEYNFVENSGIGVENSGKSNLEIKYNDINANVCIYNSPSNQGYNDIYSGWTKASLNNLAPSTFAVESTGGYYYSDGPYPLDFKNNYWGVTSAAMINEIIKDYNDIGLVVGTGVSSIVEYTPYRTSRVATAGIR